MRDRNAPRLRSLTIDTVTLALVTDAMRRLQVVDIVRSTATRHGHYVVYLETHRMLLHLTISRVAVRSKAIIYRATAKSTRSTPRLDGTHTRTPSCPVTTASVTVWHYKTPPIESRTSNIRARRQSNKNTRRRRTQHGERENCLLYAAPPQGGRRQPAHEVPERKKEHEITMRGVMPIMNITQSKI